MAISHLTTVPDSGAEPGKSGVVEMGRGGGDVAAWRMRQLQFEARALRREPGAGLGGRAGARGPAGERAEGRAGDRGTTATRAAEIAGGGDAYPVGARELCSRLADEL